jgi:hypothetical protein
VVFGACGEKYVGSNLLLYFTLSQTLLDQTGFPLGGGGGFLVLKSSHKMEAYKLESHINIREAKLALSVCLSLTNVLFLVRRFFPKLGFFVDFFFERGIGY